MSKSKMTTPWPKAKKKIEFPSEIHFFLGLRPRGGQISGFGRKIFSHEIRTVTGDDKHGVMHVGRTGTN
jgi:hypothetical protein